MKQIEMCGGKAINANLVRLGIVVGVGVIIRPTHVANYANPLPLGLCSLLTFH